MPEFENGCGSRASVAGDDNGATPDEVSPLGRTTPASAELDDGPDGWCRISPGEAAVWDYTGPCFNELLSGLGIRS